VKLSGNQSQSGGLGANEICLPLSRIAAYFLGRPTHRLGTPIPSGKNILNVRKDFKSVGYLWRLCLLPHITMTVNDKSVWRGNTAVLSNFEVVYCQIICQVGIRNVTKTVRQDNLFGAKV